MRRIISQDPAGSMPEPDAAGEIILASKRSDTINAVFLIGGAGVFSIILWCIYVLDPQVHAHNPGLLVLAIMWSVFLIVLPFAIINLIRGPASLVIDQTSISWVRNGRRKQQMTWSDMRNIQLTPIYTTGRGQPLIGPDRFVRTQIEITGTNVPQFILPNFGIAPAILATYIMQQQHKMVPNAPAIFTDDSVTVSPTLEPSLSDSLSRQKKTGKRLKSSLLYCLIALAALAKIGIIFLKPHH